VRGDLIRIIEGLMRRKGKFDAIIVETTGLADPAPVAQTFFVDEEVRRKTRLDAIVTVVDVKHVLTELDRAHEAQEQLGFADIVLLNKTDLVSGAQLAAVEARIRRINPYASFHRAERCNIDLGHVLGRDAFNLDRILQIEPEFLNASLDHEHDDEIASLSLTTDQAINPAKFIPWIQHITQIFGMDILRMKGIIAMQDDDQRFVVQGVHMLIEGDSQRPWKAGEKRESRLVFIGRDLPKDILKQGFEACRG
jgi:G3E family GTPase